MTKIDKIKKEIRSVIVDEYKDVFLNHLKSWWKGDGFFRGIITETGFKIWSCHYFWTGFIYPVVTGNFTTNNQTVIINLKTKINSAGLFFSILILSLWTTPFAFALIGDGHFTSAPIQRSFGLLVAFCCPFIPLWMLYRVNRKKILFEVEEIIKVADGN